MNNAPEFCGQARKVVSENKFQFSVIGLDRRHIYGMVNGLLEAGATLCRVYDPDPLKVKFFIDRYTQEKPAEFKE